MGRKHLLISVPVLLWAATANATDISPNHQLKLRRRRTGCWPVPWRRPNRDRRGDLWSSHRRLKTANQVEPGAMLDERLNQHAVRENAEDHKVGRDPHSHQLQPVQRFNRSGTAENAAWSNATSSAWRLPTTIVTARFAKFSVQFDFWGRAVADMPKLRCTFRDHHQTSSS
jgi:hypothetical protein